MDTKEIKLDDGKILTSVEYPDEQMKKLSEMMNSPQYQNYVANQMKEQLCKNLGFNEKPEQPKNVMVEKQSETNELIEFTNEQILELQNQLKDSKFQLKQANDKLDTIQYENMKLNAQIETQNKLIDTYNTKIDELQTTNNKLKEINQTLIDNNKHYWIYSAIITIIGAFIGFLLGKYFT